MNDLNAQHMKGLPLNSPPIFSEDQKANFPLQSQLHTQQYNRLIPPDLSPPQILTNNNISGVQSSVQDTEEDKYKFMGVIEDLDNT